VTTSRSILVSVQYNITEEENELKGQLKESIESIKNDIILLKSYQEVIQSLSAEFEARKVFYSSFDDLEREINSSEEDLHALVPLWDAQDYESLRQEVSSLNHAIEKTMYNAGEINRSLVQDALIYNKLIKGLNSSRMKLQELSSFQYSDPIDVKKVDEAIDQYNTLILLFDEKNTVSKKESFAKQVFFRIDSLHTSYMNKIRNATLSNEIMLDIEYDSLCTITGHCFGHPDIFARSNETYFDYAKSCSLLDELRTYYSGLSLAIYPEYSRQNYSLSDEFLSNISAMVTNVRKNITNNYLALLPFNNPNSDLIMSLIGKRELAATNNYPEYNLTPALTLELTKSSFAECTSIKWNFTALSIVQHSTVTIPEPSPGTINISFLAHVPKVCIFGNCTSYCTSAECRNDPSTYPIVFVHGYSFNNAFPAEYSVDIFNGLQDMLEKDGYLNAGAVSLYTSKDVMPGIWGLSFAPVSIKASYYYDMFQKPNNYVIVQSNSENIDTYAIRLKDIIETIKYKTGKPKVIVIAHSMGGLVTRRYIQIFGSSNIEKAVLIATPNKGIAGNTKEYCPLFGEKRECEDMNEHSAFMEKLNDGSMPPVPVYNIVATGCQMQKESGDGVVYSRNQYLEGANNTYINGTCKGMDVLHIGAMDMNKHPEVYSRVKESILAVG
jgi:uncharacterized alpha/beta hydrolase family protein